MTTTYPTAKDSKTQNWANRSHAQLHQDAVDALLALEAEVGITGALAFLLLTGGTMSGAIAMGSNKITGLANGTAATDAAAFGQIPVYAAPASFHPGNPNSTSATGAGKMMGLGTTISYTPTNTGNIQVVLLGGGGNATAATVDTLTPKWGTVPAPANGANPTGTTWGQAQTYSPPGITFFDVGWGVTDRIPTATVGSAVWIDVALSTANASDAAMIGNITCLIWESA